MKKYITYIIIGISILYYPISVFPQYSFEVKHSSNSNEILYYSFENNLGHHISIGSKNQNCGVDSLMGLILEIDKYGRLINEKAVLKIDTSYIYKYGFQKANGNYFIMGTLTDLVSKYDFNVTYLCELDQNLNLVWEKMHTIPDAYNHHALLNFLIDNDSNIFIQGRADSSLYGCDDLLFISTITPDGDLLDFKFYEHWKDYGNYGAFLFNFDSTGFILLGNLASGTAGFYNEWVELDLNLNIINQVTFIDFEHKVSTPISAKWLSNGNLLIADIATIEPITNKDLYIKIMDQELNKVKDTLIYYDESIYIPNNNGLDFTNENEIWVGAYECMFTNFPGTEVFRIHIFDSELNLKGLKVFGDDRRYWFFDLMASSDGGCIMTGMIPDYEGADNQDGYIIKVMPEDIITGAEEILFEFDRDVAVNPNPFNEYLILETVHQNLRFSLFSIDGKMVSSEKLSSTPFFRLSTSHIQQGLYYYKVFCNNVVIQYGKLIKQ